MFYFFTHSPSVYSLAKGFAQASQELLKVYGIGGQGALMH